MSVLPALPWIHLSDALQPAQIKLRVVLDRVPDPGHKVLAQLFVAASSIPVDNPTRILESEPRLSIRQKSCLNLFIQADPFSSKRDRFVLAPQAVSTLLSLANAIAIEIKDQGVITPATERARLKIELSSGNTQIRFVALDAQNQVIKDPFILGVDETFLLDEHLRLFRTDPSLIPSETHALLNAEALNISDMGTDEAKEIYATVAELGVDWSQLKLLSKTLSQEPIVTLRAILNKQELRLHLVTIFGDDEVEIPARGSLPAIFPHADGLQERPTEIEERARHWLLSLGAKPAVTHRGFRAQADVALHILSQISHDDNLPDGLVIDKDTLPNIVRLPDKPVLSLVADGTTSLKATFQIEGLDLTGSLEEWIRLAQTGASAFMKDDDTLVTFSQKGIQSLANLSESLELYHLQGSKHLSFVEAALFIKAISSDFELRCEESLKARLNNFIPEIIDTDKTLPADLRTALRPYQHDAVTWMSQLHRAGLGRLLADDMGLGKTIMVLTLLAKVKEQYGQMPSLVVAPTSVIDVWEEQTKQHFSHLNIVKWHGADRSEQEDSIKNQDIVVTSYALLRRDCEMLSKISFRYLILDEAQNVKNPRTESWKSAQRIHAEQRLALSGTPIENRLLDLYSIIELVTPTVLGSEKIFMRRYGTPISAGSAERMNELRERIRPLILRRKKSDVESDLPPKIESVLHCTMQTEQRELYIQLLRQAQSDIGQLLVGNQDPRSSMHLLAVLTRLRQACCDPNLIPHAPNVGHIPSAKADLFVEVLNECLSMGRRIIIYSQFVKMQEIIHALLKKNGVHNALWLHGGTRNRAEVVRQFQDPDGPPVIVVSLKAGGTGVTLTAADTVIYYDPWWNPAVMDQAADRAHRIGQTKTVHLIKLICENSIEEQIIALSEKKRAIADDMLTADKPGLRSLTLDEIKRLLSVEIDRVKRTVAPILSTLFLVAFMACTPSKTPVPPPSGMAGSINLSDNKAVTRTIIKGKLVEAIDKDNFSYLRIQSSDGKDIWAAIVGTHPAIGQNIQLEEQTIMIDFKSKSLNRTFSKIIFGVLK